jgi:GntR family transcriptional regulator/MocR family aminotransferase
MLIVPQILENSEVPYYIQLYQYFKKEILDGALPSDLRLPSIRNLASQLSISTTPVELAYQQLLSEGFIASRPKSGYYVLPIHLSYDKDTATKRSGPTTSFPITARDSQQYTFDFHISKNDFSLFPHKIWRSLYQEELANVDLLQYGDPQGEPALRAGISAYLNSFRGLRCLPEQVVVGGDQYTLGSLLSLMLQDCTGRLGFENPGYHLMPSTFAKHGFEVIPIDLQEDGLNIERLYQSNANITYVSPSHQFPRGMTMPIAKRLALLEWARVNKGYIIEDDYDGEFRYHGRPIPSLQGLAQDSPVIYMGSFAQSVSPALCIHYMVLPRELLPLYHRLKSELYLEHSASRLNQIALHYFMERGHFGRHLRRMRQLYQRKHDAVVQSLRLHFGEHGTIIGKDAGFHLVLRVRHDQPVEQLVSSAKSAGVRITPMSYTWWDKQSSEELEFIIGFGGIALDVIDEGIRALKDAWYP